MEAKAITAMVCLSEGMTLTINITQMNFKSLAIAAFGAFAGLAISGTPGFAQYTSCNSWGNSTNCYGSNGSSYNSYGIGNNHRSFYGTTQNGDFYSGSCTRIGNYTTCSSY